MSNKSIVLIFILIMLALSISAIAQEGSTPDISGTYNFQGAYLDGSEPYTGSQTLEGSGSIYMATFSYNDVEPSASVALRRGNVLIDAYNNDACSEGAYTRQSDGTLTTMWIDPTADNMLGVEVAMPVNAAEDFTGSYNVFGSYPDGSSYAGTLDISLAADTGLYTLNYTFTEDELAEPFATTGYGFVKAGILGFSLPMLEEVAPEDCYIYVAEFQTDGTYTAIFSEGGIVGTETGRRQ